MGQYHKAVNFDKKEFVTPHKIGLGLKQVEHTHCVASLSDVLYMLTSTSPNRGGGDLPFDNQLEDNFKTFGRWVGDKVAILGDYTDFYDVPFLYFRNNEEMDKFFDSFIDISDDILPAFEKAFDVKIEKTEGWRERKLNKYWDWLFE